MFSKCMYVLRTHKYYGLYIYRCIKYSHFSEIRLFMICVFDLTVFHENSAPRRGTMASACLSNKTSFAQIGKSVKC